MLQFPDVRVVWSLGVVLLILGGFGVFAAGAITALPVILGATALGYSLDQGLTIVAYLVPVWAPIGAGMGMMVTASIMKGLRARPPK